MPLQAFALNCTLEQSSSGEGASTDRMIELLGRPQGVDLVDVIRVTDHDIKPGVTDEGPAMTGPCYADVPLSPTF